MTRVRGQAERDVQLDSSMELPSYPMQPARLDVAVQTVGVMGQAVQHAAGSGAILCTASRTLHLLGCLLQAKQGWNGVCESATAVWAQPCNLSGPEGWRAKTSVGCPNSTASLPFETTPQPGLPRLHEAEHCGGAV